LSEETREVVESFTTDPHGYVARGNKTVRARAIEFVETLQIQQVKEIPVEEAKDRFQLMIDVWDEKSLNRYFGTQTHREVQKINERKQYLLTGKVVLATIELSHDIKSKEGYLEKLGLVHYELRGKTVFMVLENAPMVPELVKAHVSNDNFSLPLQDLSHKGKGAGGKPICEGVPHTDSDGEKRERVRRGRERNRSSESEAYSVCFEAYPSGSAKDGRTDDPG
jgi:hypothetical protein